MPQITNNGNLEQGAKDLGVKLARLLAVLFPKQEEGEAMLAMAEKMTPEQLVVFIDTLEKKYLEASTKGIDDEFQVQANKLADKEKVRQEEAIKKIEEIEKNI